MNCLKRCSAARGHQSTRAVASGQDGDKQQEVCRVARRASYVPGRCNQAAANKCPEHQVAGECCFPTPNSPKSYQSLFSTFSFDVRDLSWHGEQVIQHGSGNYLEFQKMLNIGQWATKLIYFANYFWSIQNVFIKQVHSMKYFSYSTTSKRYGELLVVLEFRT